MKQGRNWLRLLAMALLICLPLIGCNGRIPVSVEVPMDLGQGYQLAGLDGLSAGASIPAGYELPGLPVCTLPSQDAIIAQVKASAGSLISQGLEIDSIDLVKLQVRATGGSFDGLTYIGAAWQPSPSGAVDPAPVSLGAVESADGFGEEIELEPPATVDILTLAAHEDQSESQQCPEILLDVSGTVPPQLPTLALKAIVRINGSVGL